MREALLLFLNRPDTDWRKKATALATKARQQGPVYLTEREIMCADILVLLVILTCLSSSLRIRTGGAIPSRTMLSRSVSERLLQRIQESGEQYSRLGPV